MSGRIRLVNYCWATIFLLGGFMSVIWKSLSPVLLLASLFLALPIDAQAGRKAAYSHLNQVMDRFHRAFHVYTDLGAAGDHFAARCAIAANNVVTGVAFDETWTQNCRS